MARAAYGFRLLYQPGVLPLLGDLLGDSFRRDILCAMAGQTPAEAPQLLKSL